MGVNDQVLVQETFSGDALDTHMVFFSCPCHSREQTRDCTALHSEGTMDNEL